MNAPNAMTEALEAQSPELTRDGFLDGRFELLQPKKGLRAGSDAMFLAACVPACAGQSIFEAGLGTGAAALALLTRVPDTRVLGVEVFAPHADLARRNAGINAMTARMGVIEGDFSTLPTTALTGELAGETIAAPFDHAMANPPYFDPACGRPSDTASQNAANLMPSGRLKVWVENLCAVVRPGGTVTFVHRAAALPELLAAMDRGLGAICVLPLCPTQGHVAIRVLVQGTRASRAPMQLLPPFVLHEANGRHTCQSDKVLRGGEALDLHRAAG